MRDGSVNNWIRRETPKHLELLTKLRERLVASLEVQVVKDADGDEEVIPADVNVHGTPSRDWCRAYSRYARGYESLLAEERENAKLQLLARRLSGPTPPLTDEEYDAELRKLGIEALQGLSTADLYGEFLRRGAVLPASANGDPGEDDRET